MLQMPLFCTKGTVKGTKINAMEHGYPCLLGRVQEACLEYKLIIQSIVMCHRDTRQETIKADGGESSTS